MLAIIHSFISHKHSIIFLKIFCSNEYFALIDTFQTLGIAEVREKMLDNL